MTRFSRTLDSSFLSLIAAFYELDRKHSGDGVGGRAPWDGRVSWPTMISWLNVITLKSIKADTKELG